MTTQELVDYIASYGIRRLPTEELQTELDFARRERDLSDNPDYELYQVKRIRALSDEIKRRTALKEVLKKSKITTDWIRDLKAKVDIRDIFNHLGILVIPNGTHRQKYECPAHPDRHPSGVVYVDDQQYHCFQCQAHGDVFDIVMAYRGMTFLQSVDFVVGYLGIEVPQ